MKIFNLVKRLGLTLAGNFVLIFDRTRKSGTGFYRLLPHGCLSAAINDLPSRRTAKVSYRSMGWADWEFWDNKTLFVTAEN
jgi:hypothetical protein